MKTFFGAVSCMLFTTTLATMICDDEERSFCQTIKKENPYMCEDPCVAEFCKKSCNKCPLTCRDCYGVERPEDCNVTMTCPGLDYECAVSKAYTHTFDVTYMLGCSRKEHCKRVTTTSTPNPTTARTIPNSSSAPATTTTTPTLPPKTTTTIAITKLAPIVRQYLIGKRSVLEDISCCDTDDCNSVTLPESNVVKRSAEHDNHKEKTKRSLSSFTCEDVNPAACVFLYMSMPDVCTKHACLAEALCPRLCGACHECYQCTGVASAEDCNTTTICNKGQQCYHMETITVDLNIQNSFGCMDTAVCSKLHTLSRDNIFGRRKRSLSLKGDCCSGNRCNGNLVNLYGINKNQNLAKSTTAEISSTTTTSRTPKITTKTLHSTTTTTSRPTTTTTSRPTTTTITTTRPTTPTTKSTTTTTQPTTTSSECFHQPGKCPDGFTMTAHGCFTATRTKMTWSNAKAFVGGYYTNREWTWNSTRLHIPNALISSSRFHHLSTHHDYCLIVSTRSSGRRRRDGSSNTISQTVLKPESCTSHYYPLCEYNTETLTHYYDPVPLKQFQNNNGGDD